MTEVPTEGLPPIVVTGNVDPEEAQMEAKEINQYLLAKSFFDCREYDRCAAVFLPENALAGVLSAASSKATQNTTAKGKGKSRASSTRSSIPNSSVLPRLSQKSLFLALYAKFMSGEKKKDEDSEMVMGPHDGGSTVNKQLVVISRFLETWFRERTTETGEVIGSQGWLEYLYANPYICESPANIQQIWHGSGKGQERRRCLAMADQKCASLSYELGMLARDDFSRWTTGGRKSGNTQT